MRSRTFFFLLLTINAALGGLLAWQLLAPPAATTAPAEEHVERVRLDSEMPASAAPASAVAVASAPAAPGGTAASAPAPAPVTTPPVEVVDATPPAPASTPVAAPAAASLCARWGDFTALQWKEARAVVRAQLGSVEIEETLNEDKARYWVYLPPFDSQEAAKQAVADLRSRGINDTFIIQEPGPQQLAVSLGLFSKKAMAEEFVGRLRAKGIDRIVSKPHPQSRYISILIRGVPPAQKAQLRALAGGFEKTTVQIVPCPG